MSDKRELTVDGRSIVMSNPDKVLYPDVGLTKSDVLDHYRRVADVMLPHLHGRPLTLRRFPDGIEVGGFFQKEASDFFPDWLRVVKVPRREAGPPVHHVVCESVADLLYLAGLATLEFHVWPSTESDLDNPDRMVIDIDPPDGTSAGELRDVARRLRAAVEELGLTGFVQATGGRGFHVVTPLDATADYDDVRQLARDLVEEIAAADPDRLTTAIRKGSRQGRIFLDVNRNGYGQTFVAPYSLRARPGAPIATPLDWSELGKATPNGFDSKRLRRRLAQKADPWRQIDQSAGSSDDAARRDRRRRRSLPWRDRSGLARSASAWVSVPVRMYTAIGDHTIRFQQYERGTSDRIRYKRVNERTGKEVDVVDLYDA